MRKTIAASILVVAGLTFIVTAFAANLFSAGPAFERMTDNFRPQMTTQQLATYQNGVDRLGAVASEFQTKVAPTIAGVLKMSPTQFNTYMGQNYPAVAAGVKALPTINSSFDSVLATLRGEQARFASADAIPTSSIPATTVPWMVFFAGVIAMLLGLALLAGARWAAGTAAVLALALVVVPLALSLPTKASNADTMNAHLKPVYTAQLVAGAKQSLGTLQAMGTEMQTKMLPALMQATHMTQAQMNEFFATTFPNTAAALNTLPAQLQQFGTLVGTFDKSLPDYNTLKPVALLPVVWILIGGGIAMTIAAFSAIPARRKGTVTLVEPHQAA
jgi:hypothetical protein